MDLDLVSRECFFTVFLGSALSLYCLPFSLLLFCQQVVWDLEDSGPLFVFSSLPPFLVGVFIWIGTPWAKGGMLARDMARMACMACGLKLRA